VSVELGQPESFYPMDRPLGPLATLKRKQKIKRGPYKEDFL